jgi:hypothetical protein
MQKVLVNDRTAGVVFAPVKKGDSMKPDDELLTQSVRQAAKEAGIGVNQAYEAVHRGEIPTIRIGKRILVLRKPWRKKLEGGETGTA